MNSSHNRKLLVIAAWAVILIVSDLPDIVIKWMGDEIPSWMFWAKAAFLALFLGLTLLVRRIRLLWQYGAALLTLFLALGLTGLLRNTAWFQSHYNYRGVPYLKGFAALMVLDIFVTLAVISVLWLMKGNRTAFFLVKGRLESPVTPIRWLGIKSGESWKTFTWIFAGIAALAVAVPTILSLAPSAADFKASLPLLPAAVLFAAVNAFTEEVYFRCNLLSTMVEVVGRTHTLLIIVVFFGLSHRLYGSPAGPVGFALTGFLAWIMARSMLETKGLLSPWIIHFFPDVVIFFSYALAQVKT